LNIQRNNLTANSGYNLVNSLSEKLEDINLSNNRISMNTIELLSDRILKNEFSNLIRLNISDNNLNDLTGREICSSL
jgi:Ran GTPase-activating protein (RanGAP) involved in mRNA processing and transport